MKKLFAILLSMLMLCTMIPFATVSAADEITIVVEVSEEEVKAGDEFEVTVYLEGNPGVMGVQVEILFDTDAMEIVGEWDGEDFYPEISSPRKWKANFLSYGPPGTCLVSYVNGTASSNITEEEFFTALFVAKEDAYTGDYALTVRYKPNNFFGVGFTDVIVRGVENGTIHIDGREPEVPSCEHEYTYACDKICAKCGELTNESAEHTIAHVEAKDATCTENGNIEHWYCEICGYAWADEALTQTTNIKNVILPATGEHTYSDNLDVDCDTCGDIRVVDYVVKTFGGNSIAESSDGLSGLAFRYNLTEKVEGLVIVEGTEYVADYTNAYVTPDSTGTYKLVKMGAVLSNNGSIPRLENVNGSTVLDVEAKKIIMEGEGAPYYVIRIVNIPEKKNDAVIIGTSYFIYENAEGEQIVVYGEEQAASVNSVLQTIAD